MAAIQPYTPQTFKEYLHSLLGHTAAGLSWSVAGGSYDEILSEALLAIDTDDITTITDNAGLGKIRAVGRYCLWSAVAAALAGEFDFSADGGSYSRNQAHENALKMLDRAEIDLAQYGLIGYVVTSSGATYGKYDPYQNHDDALSEAIDQAWEL